MLTEMLKKRFFFILSIYDMAAFDRNCYVLKKYLLCTLSRSRLVQTCHYRSSLSQMFFKIDVLKNFANFIGKHQCWSLACNFIKKRLQHRCFHVKFANFLRTPPMAASEQTQEISVVHLAKGFLVV